jgi:hypothetical protein
VVALWKGPGQQPREIPLQPGAQGVLLSAVTSRTTRRSFDGRRPAENGSEFSDVTVHQVRAASTGTRSPQPPAGSPPGPILAAEELTILTSWAEAAAEALAFAPERIEAVAAAAQAGAPWRAELRICEPSPPLSHAINDLSQAGRTAAASGVNPPMDAVLAAAPESQPGQPASDRLARAVLRSALEQRQTRQAGAADRPPHRFRCLHPAPYPAHHHGAATPATR